MWQQFLIIVPAIVVLLIGMLTFVEKEKPLWKRITYTVLIMLAIFGLVGNQWWIVSQEAHAKAVILDRRNQLAALMSDGQSIADHAYSADRSSEQMSVAIHDWTNKTEAYLNQYGPSYVIRFKSEAGYSVFSIDKNPSPDAFYQYLENRIRRLDEFSSELR